VASALLPNLSSEDQSIMQEQLGLQSGQVGVLNRKMYGHLQGNDFVLNYLAAVESGSAATGNYMLAASHGMGFMPAAALIRC
jgi:hypothetical protein